jgi:4-aminobutyrate aminotransferase/(S)-3-amino-2-methylpropionate transaminase
MDAWPPSDGEAIHTTTFMGHPLGCAASLASLGVIEREGLVVRSAEEGTRWMGRLEDLASRHSAIGHVRGRGLMIGIDLVKPGGNEPDPELAGHIVTGALRRGWLLLAGGPHGNVLSLSPPLNIDRALLDAAVTVLDDLLSEKPGGG